MIQQEIDMLLGKFAKGGIAETEIRRDVKVVMPSLDLFPKTK